MFNTQKQTQVVLSDGSTFLVNHWNKMKCFNRISLFGRVIGIPFTELVSKGEDGFFESLPTALAVLFGYLDETSLETIILTLLDDTLAFDRESGASPVPCDIEKHCKDLGSVIELCAEVFQCHYGSLFRKEVLEGVMKLGRGTSALSN